MLHAVAYAPEDALGGNFLNTPWESVATAFRVSTFSLKELAVAVAPVMTEGGSIVALDFDNSTQAWPVYDWMGVCKAGMISVIRYLARDLGPKNIRVNAVASGPLVTIAAKGIPGFKQLVRHLDPVRAAAAGTRATAIRWSRRRSWRSCRTGSRGPPPRWCTWTVGGMPSARHRWTSWSG